MRDFILQKKFFEALEKVIHKFVNVFCVHARARARVCVYVCILFYVYTYNLKYEITMLIYSSYSDTK